jgi:PAS domain S-box-containing protein
VTQLEIQNIPVELIDALPIAVSVRIDGKIVYANKQCIKLSGFKSLEDLVGVNADDSIHPDDKEQVEKAHKQDLGAPVRYRVINLQENILYLETSIFAALWGGTPAEIHLSRDISDETITNQNLENTTDKLLALHSHISELAQAESVQNVLQSTFDALSNTLGYTIVDIIRVSGVTLIDTLSLGQRLITTVHGPGITSRVVRTRETQLITDTQLDPDYIQGNRNEIMRSELVVPVIYNDDVQYLLNIENKNPDFFSELDVKMVEAMASHMSNALTRIQLETRRILHTNRLRALHRHAAQSGNLYTVDDVAANLFETLGKVLDFQTYSLGLIENDTIVFKHLSSENPPIIYPLNGPGITVRAIKTGKSQLIPDVRKDPDFIHDPDFIQNHNITILSELAVPITVNNLVSAVINIESEELNAFNEDDKELVEIIASHVSASLARINYVTKVKQIEHERSDEAIQGISRVTNMVNHDLKGPLSIIKNSVYLVKNQIGDVNHSLNVIDENVDRINEIITDLGERTLTGNMVKVLGDLVATVKESLSILIPSNTIELVFTSSQGILYCNYDQAKINRVVNNLVFNAFEAMPDGGKVTVSINKLDDYAAITVKDTGIGMSSEVLDKMFNPYFTTKSSGMGIGLNICKQIIDAHQGTISVDSTIGQGSTFTVKLPL